MKVWPGPRVLVPMATDILLVGKNDVPLSKDQGIRMSCTKTDYANMFLKGADRPVPFNILTVQNEKEFPIGAHIMWTLPHALRKGHQKIVTNDAGEEETVTEFPLVPNRWLITRFEYSELSKGTPPKVISKIIKSEVLSKPEFPSPFNKSLYPQKISTNEFPYQTIGASEPLEEWDGTNVPEEISAPVKAVGPGAISWSVLYDNIQNVFSFVDDDLSEDATPGHPFTYTYSIIGWYNDPENDLLQEMEQSEKMIWEDLLKEDFGWIFSDSEDNNIDEAIDAWEAWVEKYGLNGSFDPTSLNLAPQEKEAITLWHAYWKKNGQSGKKSNLATQLLCHSMICTVEWKGSDNIYGSGNPLSAEIKVPKLTVGSSSYDAISTYVAHEIQQNSASGLSKSDIPIVARALTAFQKDLLDEYADDPIKVENLLHADTFAKTAAGSEWIVVRTESNTDSKLGTPPSTNAGKQSIPLNEKSTDALTLLNKQQRKHDAIKASIETTQAELYRLIYKQYLVDQGDVSINNSTKKMLTESLQALTSHLSSLRDSESEIVSQITSTSDTLSKYLLEVPPKEKEKHPYDLKQVDLVGYAMTMDPVIAIVGAEADTKLSTAVGNNHQNFLAIRYTGQFISEIAISSFETYDPVLISSADILENINLPGWSAFPKEVLNLWIETLLLDTSMASNLAVIYFEKNNVPASIYNAPRGADRRTPLQDLTVEITKKQSLVWHDPEEVEYSGQVLADAAGFNGILPAHAGVGFRQHQPWTPIFVDWKVKYYPTSPNSLEPFKNWKLGEIDYVTKETSLPNEKGIEICGRSILNPNISKNIQERLEALAESSLSQFPPWLQDGLQWASRQAGSFDVLTQTLSGFNEQLVNKIDSATAAYSSGFETTSNNGNLISTAKNLIGPDFNSLLPVLGTPRCTTVQPEDEQYAPIRSGHIEIVDVNVVDAFGQVMLAKLNRGGNEDAPIQDVSWSESLSVSTKLQTNSYGQLTPRLLQPSKVSLDLLAASTSEEVISNSSDSTSPICGWIMANHLDHSLMVFTSSGVNLGAIIKVQSEKVKSQNNWSIRWDAAPGSDHPLGAAPQIKNVFLADFINNLLETGFTGAQAFDDLMLSIDSTLWTLGTYKRKNVNNLSLLVGRPIAVVRAQVDLEVGGDPIYKQYWCNTGDYYNKNGKYNPVNPPYMSVPFSLRIGDAFLAENGVLGYFANNKYNEFYPVYGASGQTKTLMELLRAGQTLDFNDNGFGGEYTSDYMKKGALTVHTTLGSNESVPLTILVDPEGTIPVYAGSLPSVQKKLPTGPVALAMTNLNASFRVGPLLLAPDKIQMPTPAEVNGKWSWIAKKDTVSWLDNQEVSVAANTGELHSKALRLKEGWLDLSEFQDQSKKS